MAREFDFRNRGWITPNGRVLPATSYSHHVDIIQQELGNLPFTQVFDIAFSRGYIRYWWHGLEGFSLSVEGSPTGLEAQKFTIMQELKPKKLEVWDNHGDRLQDNVTPEEFLDTDWSEVRGHAKYYFKERRGRGWWDDRPEHREAALRREHA